MGRKLPRFMPDDDGQAILRATTTQRDRLLLLVCRYFGLRVSEVCNLQIEDLDFKRRVLMVRGGKGDKDRAIPMPAKMVGPLRGWCAGRKDGFVFPSPRGGSLTPRAVQLLVKRLAEKAGLHKAGEVRRYTPHKFPTLLRLAAVADWSRHHRGTRPARAQLRFNDPNIHARGSAPLDGCG